MAWEVVREEPPHFVVRGDAGEFRVHQGNLSPRAIDSMRKMCKGGPVQRLASGGTARADADEGVGVADPPAPTLVQTAGPAMAPEDIVPLPRPPAAADDGDPSQFSSELHRDDPAPPEVTGPTSGGVARADDDERPPAQGVPSGIARPPDAGQAQTAPMQFPPIPAGPDTGRLERDIGSAVAEGRSAADLQAQAEQQKSKALVGMYQQHVADLQQSHAQYQGDLQTTKTKIDQLTGDIEKATIDPQHFWSDKSTAQKVTSGIGLILAGIGSGLTGQPNLAAQFLQRSVDRDIDAQKANLGKKETLLSSLYRRYGNIQEAEQATRGHLMAVLAGQVGVAGAQAGSTAAQAAAAQLKSQLSLAAFTPLSQIVTQRYNAELQRRGLQFQQSWMQYLQQQGGQQQGAGGYLPSLAPPPQGMDPGDPMKWTMEARKDAAERTLVGPGGRPFLAYKKETADKYGPQITAGRQVAGTLKQLYELANNNSGAPGTDAARMYKQYRASLPEQWAMTMGLTQPSEISNKNLEEVMPSSWDAFVRGGKRFEPITRLLHERMTEMYRGAGLHPSALPVLQLPEN